MAMTILFNLNDEQADIKATKTELYQLVIDVHSWGKFIELYKKNIEIYEPESLASQ
jgi:ribosome-associated toxin RatA of RatAB toxin-antitoxin module